MRGKRTKGVETIHPQLFPTHLCVLLVDSRDIFNTQSMFSAVGFQIVKSFVSNGSEQRRTSWYGKIVYLIRERLGDENI